MKFSQNIPKKGSLLLSEPFILDPNFERSVVLLSEHNQTEGTTGFVLNHLSETTLGEVIGEEKAKHFPIFLGGPVEPNALFYIHRISDKLQSGTHIAEDIYWGGDFDRLILLIQEDLIQPHEVKFFAGYSGWEPNQLEEELNQNSWAVSHYLYSDLCFLSDGEDLWKRALIDMGPRYAHIANFPKAPYLN